MLRTRPIHYTSALNAWARLFTELGLKTEHDAGNWRLFTSGHGSIGLHFAELGSQMDGRTTLGFEIRDREIFVRRTLADGTPAELIHTSHGPGARVTAPNDFSFTVDPVADLSLPDPSAKLTVVQLWSSQDVSVQHKILTDIGAKQNYTASSESLSSGSASLGTLLSGSLCPGAVFSAKNGGFTQVNHGEQDVVEVAFEYGGRVLGLAQRLALKGLTGNVVDRDCGTVLLLNNPDNTAKKISIHQKVGDPRESASRG